MSTTQFLCAHLYKDDGPWIYHQDIVNTLDQAGAKGTFFFSELDLNSAFLSTDSLETLDGDNCMLPGSRIGRNQPHPLLDRRMHL